MAAILVVSCLVARQLPNKELSPTVHDLTHRMDKELRVAATHEDSVSSHHSDAAPDPPRPHHSKLKLELPHFSGDLLHWKDFWDIFSAVIESERLSDREKICHLQASMRSEEAKSVVRHATANGNYDNVVTALKKRYDKNHVVYMHHVASLHSRAPTRSSCDDLIRCIQEIELHYSGVVATQGDTLGQYLAAMTLLLMDSSCASHWADYTSKRTDPPDLDTVREFCEHHIAALQSNPLTKKSSKPVAASSSSSSKRIRSSQGQGQSSVLRPWTCRAQSLHLHLPTDRSDCSHRRSLPPDRPSSPGPGCHSLPHYHPLGQHTQGQEVDSDTAIGPHGEQLSCRGRLGPSGGKSVTITAHIIDSINTDCPDRDVEAVRRMPFLKGLQLAWAHPDVLTSFSASQTATEDGLSCSPDKCLIAQNTLFGLAVGGSTSGQEPVNVCLAASAVDKRADKMLQLFWTMEEVPGDANKRSRPLSPNSRILTPETRTDATVYACLEELLRLP